MDVVGVENMTIEPFQPEIRDGRLYGRGAYDMKGGLAAILGAANALHEAKWKPEGDVYLAFVADEEYASVGTAELVKKLNVDAAILTEPTEMQVCTAHRGFAWLTITTHGRAAHGSLFDEGVDAIAHMGRVLGALEAMDAETLSKRAHPLLQRPSVHASLIDGGLGLSTYPDACRLQIEHRLLPDESGENVLALWQGALSRLAQSDPAFSAEVTLGFERPGYEIAADAPIVQMLDSVYQAVTEHAPKHVGQMAWLDAALLGEAGIPTVILGPSGTGAHAAVEYVDLASVHECASVLAEAVVRWTSQPGG
jgi:acetylornithine deacetylase